MARIRTLTFLPEIFQTDQNREFLAATLDQIVNPPVTTRIQGYVGSKLGYGINPTDKYVTEPNKVRTDYQLEPGVVFTNPNETTVRDFISYPGILDSIKLQNGFIDNNNELFESQFYSWDSFVELDKLINYNQYYWLPEGAPAVTVSNNIVFSNQNYEVVDLANGYNIFEQGTSSSSVNPTLTLLRGGSYTFAVNQDTSFWIQGEPGVSGNSLQQPNQSTREILGVSNNGANQGLVIFNVPSKNAQDEFNFANSTTVNLVSDIPFNELNGSRVADLVNGVDGVTGLNHLTVMFYNTGVDNELGYIGSYFDESEYDINLGLVEPTLANVTSISSNALTLSGITTDVFYATDPLTQLPIFAQPTVTFGSPVIGGIVPGQVYYVKNVINSTDFTISATLGGPELTLGSGSGLMPITINQGLYEDGFYTSVNQNFYRIEYVGNPSDPVIRLMPAGTIPSATRITPTFGTEYINLGFYKNIPGNIALIPYISANRDILYYQDGTNPNKVGVIRIIDSNETNTLNVETQILGRKTFISTNGIQFTNGLKVNFSGDVIPASYLSGEYFVEGVGTGIELIPVDSLVCPERFTGGIFNPFGVEAYDETNYDVDLFVPIDKDYITIARNSISKNAWARSNRWFHVDVINVTSQYNNNPNIVSLFATETNKATRPIVEFYPNLALFNSGTVGKRPVDFYDTRQVDALSVVSGTKAYYPDVEVYTGYVANIDPVTGTQTTLTIAEEEVVGMFQVGMFVADTGSIIPTNARISEISGVGTGTITLTIDWPFTQVIPSTSNVSVVGTDTTPNAFELYTGARIIFSNDADPSVRNKIYVANVTEVVAGQGPVVTLALDDDSQVLSNEQVVITRGFNYRGKSLFFTGTEWKIAQQKATVNQAPLFDVFDDNGVSFGDNDIYVGTSFTGNKLFAYGLSDSTIDDPVLGFPVRFSSIDNIGDISFDISINLDTFEYVDGINPIIQKVNTGYVHDTTTRTTYGRKIGWQTAVAPSVQYQVFSFTRNVFNPVEQVVCDIPMLPEISADEQGWPRIQVFFNHVFQPRQNYTVNVGSSSTTITLNSVPSELVETVIQVLLLSDEVSKTAYYTIPINLSNNPLNGDITSANIGDIRLQYRDIFINSSSIEGEMFGPNNFRDKGNLVPYGSKIIQNSASLALPGAFLRNKEHNLFNALLFNSREYVKYKQLLVNTVETTDYVQRFTPSQILDDALDQINSAKSQINSFFWSDMLPSKAPTKTSVYTFVNGLDTTIYPLTKVYNFDTANYNSVLVYIERTEGGIRAEKQLIRGVDYEVSSDNPSLTVTLDLVAGDRIIVKEYTQTYGSYVPNTPTKLGLYPASQPRVILDDNYSQPTYFILGHDGSYTKLYGEYLPESDILVDFRDQALLEFEKRIYNNLKLSNDIPIKEYEILPGFFRDTGISWEEFNRIYSPNFLNWIGQNRIDYKTQLFNRNNQLTYNYSGSQNKLSKTPILQGYWRGIYQYLYDTTSPDSTPWEMLGFTTQPFWWENRYGPAPYTSDNTILWGDLETGTIWNDGNPYIVPELARPGLSSVIPVDSNGQILTPFTAIVGNYNPNTFQKDWKVGDLSPAELSYRRSSTWPFDLMRIYALTKPAKFYNLGVDLDNYKFSTEFNQYLVNNRQHLDIRNIQVYGTGTAKTSYINWIVDYEKQVGIAATENIEELLDNVDVRLVYRLAGFSDKTMLKFFVEKGSPNSETSSLLIPDESYQILLYDNQPSEQVIFSSVMVQRVANGWTVFGNSQTFAYFTTLEPLFSGNFDTITVVDSSVKLTKDYGTKEIFVPYGTLFYSLQEVSQFIMNYAAWLKSKGLITDLVENGEEVNWQLMVKEFLYWAQMGWDIGSVITLNPSATLMKFNKESLVVEPLTVQQQNFVLNQDLYPINLNDLCVHRDGTEFSVSPLNDGDSLSYAQFNMSNFEHGIVFDNTTLFNDTIYNLVTGLRQNRINVSGTKSAEWNGTVFASGFIMNQDNVKEWSRTVKYTRGQIVKYKNRFYSSLNINGPSATFNELDWVLVDYENIQKGMLPNASTRAYESTLYYDINRANLEQDANLLGYSLIGYRPRDYLALIDLPDVTQINVYKNFIRNKGTRNATLAFRGANAPQGIIEYDIYENWAIQSSEYGGVLSENFVDFKLSQPSLTGNPSIVSLNNGLYTQGSNQAVPIYKLYNYGRVINTPNILSTTSLTNPIYTYPSAGYVNFNDVEMASYFYSGLPAAIDANDAVVPIEDFYVRDYMWLANFKEKWGVYTWKPAGNVVTVSGNLNGTSVVTFAEPHNFKRLDPIAIINFAANVNGYYIVTQVLNINEIVINLSINNATDSTIDGNGIALSFINQRVATPADIQNIDLLEAEFIKNTVWVDEDSDGSWGVYRKNINYSLDGKLAVDNSSSLGAQVAYSPKFGYIVSDPIAGKVYRYALSSDNSFDGIETLTGDSSFGATIVYSDDLIAISKPTGGTPEVSLYTLNDTLLTNDLLPYQTISAPGMITNWGTKVAISGDSNWVYISVLSGGNVYVYRKQYIQLTAGYFNVGETYVIDTVGNTDFTLLGAIENKEGIVFVATDIGTGTGTATQITYQLARVINGSSLGLSTSDGFGKSISTNYLGDVILVTAPNVDFGPTIEDWGKAYVYQRATQNIEVQNNSLVEQAQLFPLGWAPDSTSFNVVATVGTTEVELDSVTGISVNDPIIFTGIGLGGTDVTTNKVYYVGSIDTLTNRITLKLSRNTNSVITLIAATVSGVTATVQTTPIYVYVNGKLVTDDNYAVVSNILYYTNPLNAGDIITVSDSQFNVVQEFNSSVSNRTNIQYGYSSEMDTQGSELLVGAPFEIADDNEGSVYRYINGGAKYGMIVGTSECSLSSPATIFLNGYMVQLPAGNATDVAATINAQSITNIRASAVNNMLMISLINLDLAQVNQKLVLTVLDETTLQELGITLFINTQVIKSPHKEIPSMFGANIKLSDGTLVVAAPTGTRFTGTTFDFTDDENLDNDTVFDNNSTRFVEGFESAGAVYMFDVIAQFNENVLSSSQYVYAQSLNSDSMDYGLNTQYGFGLDINANSAIIGSPGFNPVISGGEVIVYKNAAGVKDWSIFRKSALVVDINKITNSQIYSAETNETLINLDYIDPLNGKLLGAVRSNIDYVLGTDPAKYNSDLAPVTGLVWGENHVGEIWFNTNNVRFFDYHQNDNVYNASRWGKVFPGSDVAVYTWVESNTPPSSYTGPGTPLNNELYSVSAKVNNAGLAVPVYYFWTRNTNQIVRTRGKTLSDSILERYISNPQNSGISYFAPILPNSVALYNCSSYINANDSVFHLGYSTSNTDDVSHNEYVLIRENNPEDFLPGLPSIASRRNAVQVTSDVNEVVDPFGLYDRLLDSMSGCDETGQVVPNPFLPKAKQTGILARPRQSFFYNRYIAIQNYLIYANTALAQFPIAETRENATFLFEKGEFFDTSNFWEYVNWWSPGYNDNTKSIIQVPEFADLLALSVPTGTIVTVEQNGAGKFEVYIKDGSLNGWTRIGLENGTIRFKNELWDYDAAKFGFGGDFFDTTVFDNYPSEETRFIVRALTEQIYIDELAIFRNKSLILLFEYIQSETSENQNYLPWLNKTSLIDVAHTIRELLPLENLRSDNQEFLEGYIEEVKPYHVVIKDYLFKYTKTDVFEGDITDFDLPAQYNAEQQRFITPQLVYGDNAGTDQYSIDDSIWETQNYNQWFNNRGVEISPQPNFRITTTASFVSNNSSFILVDNAQGMPINGVIRLGDELIAYSFVDRSINVLGGLTRGVDNTIVSEYLPGTDVFIDLPSVLVLDGGRGYSEPPKVRAVIDTSIYPEPIAEAQLEAIMGLDSVIGINVIDPGQGYAALPEIVIDPASVITFDASNVNNTLHTINVFSANVRTGDVVRYRKPADNDGLTNLQDGQWYYVGVLETTPLVVIALYDSITDVLKDHDRLKITALAGTSGMILEAGARATAVTSAYPIRENNIELRFDRTTYGSQVIDWVSNSFYGSFFAGSFLNTDSLASSSTLLDSEEPNIDNVLASAQGVPFEIEAVGNDRQLTWSSFPRNIIGVTNNAIRIRPAASTFVVDGFITDNVMTVTNVISGVVNTGIFIYGEGINPALTILEQLTGTTGGIGTYLLSGNSTVTSTAILGYELNVSGSTNGFYEGLPVKFEGFQIGGLIEGEIYYIKEIVNEIEFKISDTPDGAVKTLFDSRTGIQTLQMFTGEVVDTAILTMNYPGILEVTETNGIVVTVPMSLVGTGGTTGFYTNLPIFFTGDVFGGVIENEVYYVTTVLNSEQFTMSTKEDPLRTKMIETVASIDSVKLLTTSGFSTNDPIIFTGGVFGGIQTGTVYYVRDILSSTDITISTAVNGPIFSVTDAVGDCNVTNQKDTVTLENATGTMIMNVSLPVSPGQINGQLFTFFQTSAQFTDITAGVTNLLERDVQATMAGSNRISLSPESGGTNDFYVNMPIRVADSVGGLDANTTYYIVEYSGRDGIIPNIEVTVTNTSGTLLTASTPTDTLYPGMPIVFSGSAFGGIVITQPYFVYEVTNSTQFKITEMIGGSPMMLSVANGTMKGTGTPFIQVSATQGGAPETLTDQTGLIIGTALTLLVQSPDVLDAVFDVSFVLGGYRVLVDQGRSGFALGNTFEVPGNLLGGTSPENDLRAVVNRVNEFGEITDVIATGTPLDTSVKYYLKVINSTQAAVYQDAAMTIPVSGIDFPFNGFTVTTVTSIQGQPTSPSYITVDDASQFIVGDAVVFTGDVFGGFIPNRRYYIVDINGNDIQISVNPGGTPEDLTTGVGSFSMAKQGSYIFLPDPINFIPSIVKYLDRVWICIISNNDPEFIVGKWEELRPDDRRLNAMDRVIGYYRPTVNMPGADLTQLFDGTTYPNPTYRGNAFQPDEQFIIDTSIQGQPLSPTEVNITSVVFDGENYIASANLPNRSVILRKLAEENWTINTLTNSNISLTDLFYNNTFYVMTSNNSATPVFRSIDGIEWSTDGYYIPFGSTVSDFDSNEIPLLSEANASFNSVAYNNGVWVAVGDGIYTSTDTYVWSKRTNFDPLLEYVLYNIEYVTTTGFSGFIAVGKGKFFDVSSGTYLDTSLIFTSQNGVIWSQEESLTPNGLNSVSSNGTIVVAVGENNAIYFSQNANNWFGVTEASIISVNNITNQINVSSTAGLTIDVAVTFTNSFANVVAGDIYYVRTIDSATQFTIADTIGGPTFDIDLGSVPIQTLMLVNNAATGRPNLTDVIYNNNQWMAVGDEGTILTSSNNIAWVQQSSTTTDNLNRVVFNSVAEEYLVVGDENAILFSTDEGIVWNSLNVFTVDPPVYNIRGSTFEYGYGPEELVPGVVTDNLLMTVETKSGSNWPVTLYGHYGFNVRSTEITPDSEIQTAYSFADLLQHPSEVNVQNVDPATSSGRTLSRLLDYTVDWVNKLVILTTPLSLNPLQILRIEAYEVGNGNQLVRSSTNVTPIRNNSTTGFNELFLDCNLSEPTFLGGGVFRPGTQSVIVDVTATTSVTNRITGLDVSALVLNSPITFTGAVFGNIQENVTYFVKSISVATNSFTVSDTVDTLTGVAGPAFSLTDDTGTMIARIQSSNGIVWSEPFVKSNDTFLVLGVTGQIFKSSENTNTFTTNSTIGLFVGERITFGDDMFVPGIQPNTTYYINSIPTLLEFSISETIGGPTIQLIDAFGKATFVTNDYAFDAIPGTNEAKLVLAATDYNSQEDYIVYSIFGESNPEQYGYSVPETQEFISNGTTSVFSLTNFLGYDNIPNAIVEVDGLRLLNSQYLIDSNTEELTLSTIPANGSVVRVTTFGDTRNQYLVSNFNLSATPGSSVITLEVGETRHSTSGFDDFAGPAGPPVTSSNFIIGQTYVIDTAGTTDFTLIGAANNTPETIFTATGPGTGTGTAYVGYDMATNIPPVIVNASEMNIGSSYEIVTLGDTNWNNVAGTFGQTYSAGDVVTVINAGSGTGTASTINSAYDQELNWLVLSTGTTADLIIGSSVVFAGNPAMLGGLVEGQVYYVTEIWNSTTFVISEQQGGTSVTLTDDSGSMSVTTLGITVAPILNVNNEITPPLAQTTATQTFAAGNEIQLSSVAGIVAEQTIQFKGSVAIGGLAIDGTVYFVESIDTMANRITIKDFDGNQVSLTNGIGTLQVTVGGNPTVRITTSVLHRFNTNDFVRIDNVNGSVQLNDNSYYVHVIDPFTVDLYMEQYSSATNAVNIPVTGVSSYSGSGYIWKAGSFYLYEAVASATSNIDNTITVNSTDTLIEGTPVYFNAVGSDNGDDIMGGIIQGTEYYVREIIDSTTFTISSEREGDEFVLDNSSGNTVLVTQWKQMDADRLIVTINGYRIPSSNLNVSDVNELTIATQIVPGDSIIITSMIPTGTPNKITYLNLVNAEGQASVYRSTSFNTTWTTKNIYPLTTQIEVNNVNDLVARFPQNNIAPFLLGGYYLIDINGDKNNILYVEVFNNSRQLAVDPLNYRIVIEDLAPILQIDPVTEISTGDSLTITVVRGGLILVNQEPIRFTSVDLENNILLRIQRAVNGTVRQDLHPQYSSVTSILEVDKLPETEYFRVWNYDTVTGSVPLQISDEAGALFLRNE